MDDWIQPKDDGLLPMYKKVCDLAYGYYTSLAESKTSPGAQVTEKTHKDTCTSVTDSIIQNELMYIRVIIDLLANRSL